MLERIRKMMTAIKLGLVALFLLSLSVPLMAEQVVVKDTEKGLVTVEQNLSYHLFKQNIKKVNIFGTEYNRIHIFIRDDQKHTFRIPNLTEDEVQKILERVKGEEALVIQAEPVKHQKYMDVVSWK